MASMYNLETVAQRGDTMAQGLALFSKRFAWMAALGSWVAGVLAFPFESLMRHNFGERYFTFANAVFSIVFVALPLSSLLSGGNGFIGAYAVAAVVAAAFHLFVIWRRKRRGDMWYSYYDGTPWLAYLVWRVRPQMDEASIQRFVEPAFGFAVALVLLPLIGAGSGTAYLFISVAGAVMGTNLRLMEERHQYLDLIDGQLRSRYMAAAARHEPVQETHGVTMASENVRLIRELSKDEQMRRALPLQMRAAVGELSKEEQAMLDAGKATDPALSAPTVATVPAEEVKADPFAMLDDEASGDGQARPAQAQPKRREGATE